MANIKRSAYTQVLTSALTTELNSLANNAGSAASATIDNSTNLDLFIDLLLTVTFGVAPTASTTVDVYMIPSPDNTTFGDYTSGASPFAPKALLVGSFEIRAVTTAQNITLEGIGGPGGGPLPAFFKLAVINNATGQAMAASGNTLKYRTYNLTVA